MGVGVGVGRRSAPTLTPTAFFAFLFYSGNTTALSEKGLRCCVYENNERSGLVSFSREVVRRRCRSPLAASRLTTSRLSPCTLLGSDDLLSFPSRQEACPEECPLPIHSL